MKDASRDRDNVRIWLEKGLNGEQQVYVETRHSRRVLSLEEFAALVKEKLRARKGLGCIFSRTVPERPEFVSIFRAARKD